MSILLGENINLGVGVEDTRGVAVDPQAFIAARTPTGVAPVVEKVLLKETRKSRANSYGEEIVQLRAEGDLEFNTRTRSIGYILKSLIGWISSAPSGGKHLHTFKPDVDDPQQPSLTLYLAQEGQKHYQYPNAVVNSLELKAPVTDLLQSKASFMATKEVEVATLDEVTMVHDDDDLLFRPYEVSVKIADNVAGLGAASVLPAKELTLTINNNARFDSNLGNVNPADVLGLMFEIDGNFVVNYEDETYHDMFVNGDYFALQVTVDRDGDKLVITLPKCSATWKADRPIDDLTMDNVDFVAHFDADAGYQVQALLTNDVTSYAAATS